ncbi:TetR/AcrR family transcriptional regulator [Paenibacillus sp. NEAU-GSW1]|uniref:TetR/AcrR family transcriptional regulator n=1 Tax=Paenibacillus sp. NEAU-GSW1 TaxID=2682486 RepID=UPI0012E0E499|nr:TetR/AcrR family transcriptional regulator [Paenibacillus sp. NEAU-GSW1]MUT65764.1 TetR family transcriptional regulator [Paenibacillus sp. NEAU-GSW1]
MVRPREFDERAALAAAMQVFWEKGYEATSLSDLTDRMAIQRPSLYAAFGGKKELFTAALKLYVQLSLSYLVNKLQSAPSVRESLHAYFQGIIDGSGGNNPDYGCLCVNTMVEMAPHEPDFAQITADYQASLTELFRKTIERGIQSGELPKHLNPASISRLLTISAIGLSVSMKSKPNLPQVEHVASEILTLLE